MTYRRHATTKHTSKSTRRPVQHALMMVGACGLFLGACRGVRSDSDAATAWRPNQSESVRGVPMTELTAAVATQLAAVPPIIPADRWRHVQRLYRAYGNAPLWLEQDGFHEARSKALLNAILDANTDALLLDAYRLGELASTVRAVRESKQPTPAELAQADVLLTNAYVALAEDLLSGQVQPKGLAQDWHIATNRESLDSAVARSLRDVRLDSAIARMRPNIADYDALRAELVRFRRIVAQGGWPAVPDGKALKPGQRDAAVRLLALRARLAGEGFGAAVTDSASPAGRRAVGTMVYDEALAGQVAQFQARHGIEVDSMLGAETVQSLNVPATYRLAQIAANLERYRWLPHSMGERFIFVNVPAFHLEAHDSTGVLEMKTIVGEEYEGRRTPVFADSMETVVFRPYWNITPDIQAEETAPKIAADPGYMTANNLEYFEDGGEQRIRQKPGAKNSLGLVKFLFPNSYNIYLHDTPEDALFEQDVRAFSHGCIRLEKPEALAQWVLGWDAQRVRTAMNEGEDDQSVKLSRKIPVFIVYATTYVRDGALYFANDLYSRDDAVVEAIAKGVTPSAESLRQLEALRKLVE